MEQGNPMDVTSHLKTLEKSGVYYTKTTDMEDVMIYHFKNDGSRVVFFKKDHSVLEVIYGPDCEPLAMRDGGKWDNEPRGDSWEPNDEFVPIEEEENDEKKSD